MSNLRASFSLRRGIEGEVEMVFQDELGLNWYDYGARFYDPVVGRWWSVDEKSEKYISLSTYHFANNNPIKFVEKDGRKFDDYKLLLDGTINKVRTTNSATDNLYASKQDGSVNLTKKVTLSKGTLNNKTSVEPLSESGGGCTREKVTGAGTGYKISNTKDAEKLFVFASDNSKVEFGLIETRGAGSVVLTNHTIDKISASATAESMSNSGTTITTITHDHPQNSNPSDADYENAKRFNKSQGNIVNYNVYQPDKKNIVGYNGQGNMFNVNSKLVYE